MALEALAAKTPSPSVAPWWGVAVIAGFFLLAGGFLAFFSTWLSDRRKLKREDQRQWDKVLLATYLKVVELVPKLRQTRWLSDGTQVAERHPEMSSVQQELEDLGHTLVIVGDDGLFEAFKELCDATGNAVTKAHDGIKITGPENRRISTAREALEVEVRRSLRIASPQHRPRR
jgi:hypothetical protein